MVSLKDRFLTFTISSSNKRLKVFVVQMGSLSDLELLICVFLVIKCRRESACTATRPFITL